MALPRISESQAKVVVVVAVCTFISFTMASGMVMLLAYVQSNLRLRLSLRLLGLDQILDCWVGDIVNTADFIPGELPLLSRFPVLMVRDFKTEALLKSASRELATSFMSLQDGEPYFPLAKPASRNMPALVNQIPGPSGSSSAQGRSLKVIFEGIDVNRQYLVRFITDSAAGFIVKGVTLTQAIFLRQREDEGEREGEGERASERE
ncbi:hypothetical protein AK812_SmicGene162 [Symbiodinium microadriaticum]|uniref:Uncharacterized protein n=1 Tax=Symbiodinium microadriaticum TaxID=2951 RepID=A0A1Q9F7C9_SYMMI|nr:hypothetical protein AK812_SmicGene162 [Symbiodinium microadriaticum]